MNLKMLRNRKFVITLFSLTSQAVFAGQPSALNSVQVLESKTPHTVTTPLHDNNPIACHPAALVAAIVDANNASNSANNEGLVVIPANCTIEISVPTTVNEALPPITGNVTIRGLGKNSVISRDTSAGQFRLLIVDNGATLKLRNLTVQNGSTTGLGGGVLTNGTLILKNVVMTNNTASNGGAISVSSDSSAEIIGSKFIANTTTGVGGGAIINSGTLTISHSLFSGNTAPINGGAINTQSNGVTEIKSTEVDGNTSGGLGGGLSNLGVTNLSHSLVHFNTGTSGGGIATGNSNVTLVNTDVVDNTPDNCSPLNTIPGCEN